MPHKSLVLELRHCEAVLRRDVTIGSDTARDGQQKRFVFTPWTNEYRIVHGGNDLDGGQALEELLDIYNEL